MRAPHSRVLVGLAFAVLLNACGPTSQPYRGLGAKRFDRHKWLDADLAQHTRSDMAADLLMQQPLVGRTKAEIIDLLGNPEQEPHKFAEYDLVYVLGPDRTVTPIDFEWMLIKLDDQGRATRIMFASD